MLTHPLKRLLGESYTTECLYFATRKSLAGTTPFFNSLSLAIVPLSREMPRVLFSGISGRVGFDNLKRRGRVRHPLLPLAPHNNDGVPRPFRNAAPLLFAAPRKGWDSGIWTSPGLLQLTPIRAKRSVRVRL